MRTNLKLAIAALLAVLILGLLACGQGSRRVPVMSGIGAQQAGAPVAVEQPAITWPEGLPEDTAQPWEELDADGNVVPPKGASNLNFDSIFASGIERYLEAGDVSDYGEASSFASGAPGEELVSYAIYRLPMVSEQPGTIAADINVHNGGSYYIGVGDYSVSTWHWYGPYSATHVRFGVPDAEYTSGLGNLMLAVVAYDGAAFDVVAIGANARDAADTEAPPAPGAPDLTPVAGGVFAEWLEVAADDLAGYRIYADGEPVLDYIEGGTSVVVPCADEVEVTLTAVDISGNESEPSDPATETPLAGEMPVVELTATAASGVRNDVIELAATGAETYDWDIDGDGTWDFTDDPTGVSEAGTSDLGVIRPAVRAHTAEGGFSLNAISLFITGNFRPVASARVEPQFGVAPLEVTFFAQGEDTDGSIAEFAWDFNGDGIYDSTVQNPPPHTYSTPGMYNAKLRVTDDEGAWDVDTVGINVLPAPDPDNLPPTADLQADVTSGNAPLTVNFDAGGSDDSDGTIVEYAWDWDGDGLYDAIGDEPLASHVFTNAGSPEVKLRVEDDDGGTATESVFIYVNAPPMAELGATPPEGEKGVTVFFDASASSDPDGSITYYEWDLDNNGIFSESDDEEDAEGEATVLQVYPDPGYHTVTVRVTDDNYAQDTEEATVTVHGWNRQALDAASDVGLYTSMKIVNGNPAVSYFDTSNDDLKFVRAADAIGGSWGSPLTLDSPGEVGLDTCLTVVSGFPAVSYCDNANGYLKYIRATDSVGSSWGAPVIVDSTDLVGWDNSMTVVEGFPAISYYDTTNDDLKYVRANDAYGESWGSPTIVDSAGDVGTYTTLLVVNGKPAIGYYGYSAGDLKYVRAADSTGISWGSPIAVDSSLDVGRYKTMTIVADCPAFSYYDATNGDLKYVRATDANGGAWSTPIILASTGDVGYDTCLAIIDGYPAITYRSSAPEALMYIHSTSFDGSTWSTPSILDDTGGNTGRFSSLVGLSGFPAVSYYNVTDGDLLFIRSY